MGRSVYAVRSDVFIIGTSEDGEPVEALQYYVISEKPDGFRLAHEHRFIDTRKVWDAEEGIFFYIRDGGKAERNAERLRTLCEERQAAGGNFDPELWDEIDPAYGSDAWQAKDAEDPRGFFAVRERMEDEEREGWGWR